MMRVSNQPRFVKENLWAPKPPGSIIVIPVNGNMYARDQFKHGHVDAHAGDAIMKRGVAYQAMRRYPDLPAIWGRILREQGRPVGNGIYQAENAGCHVAILKIGDPTLVAFPTQWDCFDKTPFKDSNNLALIERSARELRDMANAHHWENVYLPLVGTGQAGLHWKDVMERLSIYVDDRFVFCMNALME